MAMAPPGMLRLVKLTRLSRISRLLRSVPELAIIVCLAEGRTGPNRWRVRENPSEIPKSWRVWRVRENIPVRNET